MEEGDCSRNGSNHKLSRREEEVVRLIAEDLSSRQISEKLGVTPKTIEFHKTNIYKRLGVNGVAGVMRYAIREGIIKV